MKSCLLFWCCDQTDLMGIFLFWLYCVFWEVEFFSAGSLFLYFFKYWFVCFCSFKYSHVCLVEIKNLSFCSSGLCITIFSVPYCTIWFLHLFMKKILKDLIGWSKNCASFEASCKILKSCSLYGSVIKLIWWMLSTMLCLCLFFSVGLCVEIFFLRCLS